MNRLHPAARVLMCAIAVCTSFAVAQDRQPAGPAAAQGPGFHAQSTADNEWLARTRGLYYSSSKAGLKEFNCEVHTDWRTLLVSANKGVEVANDDPRLALLNTVKVHMHARMDGGSTIDWTTAADSAENDRLLEGMHRSVQQMLEGFLQFWSPFIENREVPESADGLEIHHTETTHTIHARQGGMELTEIFNDKLLIEQYNVIVDGIAISFKPGFEPTPDGLRVNTFDAHILPTGTMPVKEQQMYVRIQYQSVDRFVIPRELNINIAGAGTFHYSFEGCTTNARQD
jgi:hypothetical protein